MSTRTVRHTRPKKLNAKQNVQIFREEQIEALPDYDQLRNNIETGVEKAEEAVCFAPFSSFSSLPPLCLCNPLSWQNSQHDGNGVFGRFENRSMQLLAMFWAMLMVIHRNTIFSKPSKQLKLQKPMHRNSRMRTYPHHLPYQVTLHMISCIPRSSPSRRPISGRRRRSRTVLVLHIAWMKRMR